MTKKPPTSIHRGSKWHPVRCQSCGEKYTATWRTDTSLGGSLLHECGRCGQWHFPPTVAHVRGVRL